MDCNILNKFRYLCATGNLEEFKDYIQDINYNLAEMVVSFKNLELVKIYYDKFSYEFDKSLVFNSAYYSTKEICNWIINKIGTSWVEIIIEEIVKSPNTKILKSAIDMCNEYEKKQIFEGSLKLQTTMSNYKSNAQLIKLLIFDLDLIYLINLKVQMPKHTELLFRYYLDNWYNGKNN